MKLLLLLLLLHIVVNGHVAAGQWASPSCVRQPSLLAVSLYRTPSRSLSHLRCQLLTAQMNGFAMNAVNAARVYSPRLASSQLVLPHLVLPHLSALSCLDLTWLTLFMQRVKAGKTN